MQLEVYVVGRLRWRCCASSFSRCRPMGFLRSPSEFTSSVLALEDSTLDEDQVENLIKFCPTKEEMELLKGYTGEKEKLGKCEQIKNSAKLKRIMQTVLSLRNALNQGTARGSAIGFSLEQASKIQLKYLAEEMQAISKGLEKVIKELSASENDGPVSENFHNTFKEFLLFSEAEVRSLASLYSGMGKNVDALILYFGEDPSRCPFEQVISTLLSFVRMFKKAHEENCRQHELEKKKRSESEKTRTGVSHEESKQLLNTLIHMGNVKL